jgi:pimeloyl-ACP methyl ester carboxylesterase
MHFLEVTKEKAQTWNERVGSVGNRTRLYEDELWVRMNRTKIDGSELEYDVHGVGEPVVFVHGGIIADAFAPLLAEPILERYQLILYHRRGYAGSTRPDRSLSVAEQAADCRALMRHVGAPRAHIVGHSYGGSIALQLALDAPEAVHSFALLEPTLLNVSTAPQLMEALGQSLQMYEAGDKTGAIDSSLRGLLGSDYRRVLDRVLPGAFAQAVADALFRIDLPGLQQWSFTQADAQRITQPVLAVLRAESHKIWPGWLEVHQLVQAWMPQAEAFVLENATHGLEYFNPKGMAEALAAFFARHSLTGRP